jgi:hypothetical protein
MERNAVFMPFDRSSAALTHIAKVKVKDIFPQEMNIYCLCFGFRLMKSELSWLSESILPEDSPQRSPTSKKWSKVDGGCEGINHEDAVRVPSNIVHIKQEVYRSYQTIFPMLERREDESWDAMTTMWKFTVSWAQENERPIWTVGL